MIRKVPLLLLLLLLAMLTAGQGVRAEDNAITISAGAFLDELGAVTVRYERGWEDVSLLGGLNYFPALEVGGVNLGTRHYFGEGLSGFYLGFGSIFILQDITQGKFIETNIGYRITAGPGVILDFSTGWHFLYEYGGGGLGIPQIKLGTGFAW